ncbi:MAG: hypothetical protein HC827_13975 [Cyanobacteria bacterium RM1_2_2]|nr:hypothetical protein [Cyanobacteria bacterium RM1_2_2]
MQLLLSLTLRLCLAILEDFCLAVWMGSLLAVSLMPESGQILHPEETSKSEPFNHDCIRIG